MRQSAHQCSPATKAPLGAEGVGQDPASAAVAWDLSDKEMCAWGIVHATQQIIPAARGGLAEGEGAVNTAVT
jgi:hypothetical protein